jgi:hypothetical protein
VVASLDVTAVVTDCQTLAIGGTAGAVIRNTGTGGTGSAFTVLFFEDRNGNWTYDAGTDAVLGTATPAALAPGAEALVASPLNGHVLFRGNVIHVFADSEEVVTESDETNNVADTSPDFSPLNGMSSLDDSATN